MHVEDEEAEGDGLLQAWLCVYHFSPEPLARTPVFLSLGRIRERGVSGLN